MGGLSYPRELRLLTPAQFKVVFAKPIRAGSPFLTILATPNQLDHPRLGLAVSKKSARRAVQRNRLRRVIREHVRLNQHQLPAWDMVVITKPGVIELDNPSVRDLLDKLWRRLQRPRKKS